LLAHVNKLGFQNKYLGKGRERGRVKKEQINKEVLKLKKNQTILG
jgi:hypothetical protein